MIVISLSDEAVYALKNLAADFDNGAALGTYDYYGDFGEIETGEYQNALAELLASSESAPRLGDHGWGHAGARTREST